MLLRVLRTIAVSFLLAGLAVAWFLPDAYDGPCSVTTEFHCGYHPRTELSIFIGALSVVVFVVLLWITAPDSHDSN